MADALAEEGICVRAGHHCTEPLHTHLGLPATLRMSLYLYNTKEDIGWRAAPHAARGAAAPRHARADISATVIKVLGDHLEFNADTNPMKEDENLRAV